MRILETDTLSVCPNCVMALHYGWENTSQELHGAYDCDAGGSQWVEEWAQGFRNWQHAVKWNDFQSSEGDPYFSWSRCEACDGDPGDRYDIQAFQFGGES